MTRVVPDRLAVRRGRLTLAASAVALVLLVGAGVVAFTAAFPVAPATPRILTTLVDVPDGWPQPTGAQSPTNPIRGVVFGPSAAAWMDSRTRIGVRLSGYAMGATDPHCREQLTGVRLVSAHELEIVVTPISRGSSSACWSTPGWSSFTGVIQVPQGLDIRDDVTISRVHAGRSNVYDRALVSLPSSTGRPAGVPTALRGTRYFWSANHRWLRTVTGGGLFDCPAVGAGFATARGDDTIVLDHRMSQVVAVWADGLPRIDGSGAAPSTLPSTRIASGYEALDGRVSRDWAVRVCPTPWPSSTFDVPLPASIDPSKPLHLVELTDSGEHELPVADTVVD